jgi:hypothetical protein
MLYIKVRFIKYYRYRELACAAGEVRRSRLCEGNEAISLFNPKIASPSFFSFAKTFLLKGHLILMKNREVDEEFFMGGGMLDRLGTQQIVKITFWE